MPRSKGQTDAERCRWMWAQVKAGRFSIKVVPSIDDDQDQLTFGYPLTVRSKTGPRVKWFGVWVWASEFVEALPEDERESARQWLRSIGCRLAE